MEQDLASYEASSFAVDASRLQFDENGKIKVEDFPALCPYSVAAHSMGLWQNDIVINL